MIQIRQINPKEFAEVFQAENKWKEHTQKRFRKDTIEMVATGEGIDWMAVAEEDGQMVGITFTIERQGTHWGCTIVKKEYRKSGIGRKLLSYRKKHCPYRVVSKVGCTNLASIKVCLQAGMELKDAKLADLKEEFPDPDPILLLME